MIQKSFLQAYSQLVGNRDEILDACEEMRSMVSDCSELNATIEVLNVEIQETAELVDHCIQENASTPQSQDEYNRKYKRLVQRYEKAVEQLSGYTAEKEKRLQRGRDLNRFIESLMNQPLILDTWNESLWIDLLDTATIHPNGTIVYRFKDGTEIEIVLD